MLSQFHLSPSPTSAGPPLAWKDRSSRRALRREAERLLGALGETPETIARHLGSAGAHGVPTDANGCVLANYLSAVMAADPRIVRVAVGKDHIEVELRRLVARRCLVALPPAAQRFVEAFDRHRFPELVRVPADHSP